MFVGMPLKKNVRTIAQANMNIILIVRGNLDDKDTSIKIIAGYRPGNARTLLFCMPCCWVSLSFIEL